MLPLLPLLLAGGPGALPIPPFPLSYILMPLVCSLSYGFIQGIGGMSLLSDYAPLSMWAVWKKSLCAFMYKGKSKEHVVSGG